MKHQDEETETFWQEAKTLFRRIPLASCAAFLMCIIGVIVFSACLFSATDYLMKILDVKIVAQIVWLWMVLHILAACVFLLLATMATGDTRREVCQNRLKHCNIIGRLAQLSAMGSAYFLHLLWLIVIALFIMPVSVMTGLNHLCPMVPDCVNLSHIGIPPDYVDMIKPDEWIVSMDSINSTDLIKYVNQTENVVYDAIVTIEESPMLDELITKIEENIPSDEEVQKFLDKLLKYVNAEPVVRFLSGLQKEVRKVDTDKVIDDAMVVVNATLEELDKVTDALEDAVEDFSEQREKAFDGLEKGINDTLGDGGDGGARRRRSVGVDARVERMEEGLKHKFGYVKDELIIAGGNILKTVNDLYATKQILHTRLAMEYGEMDDEMAQRLDKIRKRSTDAVYSIVHASVAPHGRPKRQAEEEESALKEGADEVVEAVEDGLEAATEELDKLDIDEEQIDEGLKKAEEAVEEAVEKVVDEAEKLAKEAEKLAVKAGEEVEKLAKEAEELAKKGLEEGKKVAELTEAEIKRLVEDAKRMADNADVAARYAAVEAELAIQRAEEAAQRALEAVDEEAAKLAREAEVFARKAAAEAQIAADRALEKAKAAAEEAEKLIKAAAEGAADVLLDAARNIRYYAKVAIQAAKYATREAGKGARKVAVYYDVAKVEIKKGYAEVKIWWSEKLRIEKKGRDTFCMGAKKQVCNKIDSAATNMIFVFLAAIVINKSMLHFLMAMSANWVHLKAEEKAQDAREAVEKAEGAGEKLVYTMNDEGSIQMI